jgi:hypothetical protein
VLASVWDGIVHRHEIVGVVAKLESQVKDFTVGPKLFKWGCFLTFRPTHSIPAASHPLDPYPKFSLRLEYGKFVLMGQALEEPSTIQSFSFISTGKTNLLLK